MIITRTPFRISFLGGGSDMEDYYAKSEGAVLSTSIDKYMYIASHRYFHEDQIRVKYSKTETVSRVEDLEHPIFREVLRRFGISGVEVSSTADVPAGTGLGSSSSFTVGLLNNFYVRAGQCVNRVLLAEEACEIEIDRLKSPIGKQDQYAAAFGGLNVFRFHASGAVSIEPVHLSTDRYHALQENLLMFYTGEQRQAGLILAEQKENMSTPQKRDCVKQMVDLVWEARAAIGEGKLERFGRILDRSWRLKQQLASKISNDKINAWYHCAIQNGAIGGKLLGAGGGGFLLLYCEKPEQARLRAALTELREFKFRFESEGSRTIYLGE
jgi:D-glycero-alpha-D-manno-heptose-7-phosphate kinase